MSSLQKALAEQKKSSLQSDLANEMRRNRNRNPPTVSTAHESSSSDDDSSSSDDDSSVDTEQQQLDNKDALKIRQQALKLVNTPSVGPHAEAAKKKRATQTFPSPYQQQSAGERSFGQNHSPSISSYQTSYQSSSSFAMHNSQPHSQARTAKELTLKELVVSCVSEVCKSSSSELLQKVLSSGYRSVNNYENPPVRGSWGEIDTSQHGYGNGNKTTQQRVGNMPSRYQD